MRHSGYLPTPTVMIGEIGFPERNRTKEEIIEFWDRSLAVFFALDIPLFVHWELYCNEDLKGFWLYLPEGSLSHSGKYLKGLLGD